MQKNPLTTDGRIVPKIDWSRPATRAFNNTWANLHVRVCKQALKKRKTPLKVSMFFLIKADHSEEFQNKTPCNYLPILLYFFSTLQSVFFLSIVWSLQEETVLYYGHTYIYYLEKLSRESCCITSCQRRQLSSDRKRLHWLASARYGSWVFARLQAYHISTSFHEGDCNSRNSSC